MPALSRHHQDRPSGIVSTEEATAKPATRCGRCATTRIRHDAATNQYVARRKAEGKNRKRDNPLPEAAHHPTDLPPPHQPNPNTARQRSTPPTSPSPTNPHRRRPTTRNPPGPHLRTRTRTQPQPPASNPIPEVAPHPPASPTADLTTIGASPANPVQFSRFPTVLGADGRVRC